MLGKSDFVKRCNRIRIDKKRGEPQIKEGVSRTYKGFDGDAPIMAYIGTEGFLVNAELCEGKQHCQQGTPEFLKEILRLSHKMAKKQLLIGMDSGNDAKQNLGIFLEDGSWFRTSALW